jgi:hypothetical protein
VAEQNAHELNGDGTVIMDGEKVGTVYYWLSITPKTGRVIAEGLISGPEPLLRGIKKASSPKLALEDGPILNIRCQGGRNGARWIKAVKPS